MRVLVYSDIHANLEALEAVLADAGEVEAVWCLGDVVGYGPNPNECVARVRKAAMESRPTPLAGMETCPTERGNICLAGNHDWAVLGRLDVDTFNTEARRAVLWTQSVLSPDSRAWLESRPETAGPLEGKFTLTHGSPRYPIWEYILDAPTAAVNFAYFATPVCFFGHSHAPGIFRNHAGRVRLIKPEPDLPLPLGEGWGAQTRLLVNPGSVGQPRDGDPRASYLILDIVADTITFRRVAYPFQETQAKMAAAGLPSRIIARLAYGW
jgi:predicted phosphodiesterase